MKQLCGGRTGGCTGGRMRRCVTAIPSACTRMTNPHEAIDKGVEQFLALVRKDPELAAEFEASGPVFFRERMPSGPPAETLLAARRHVEWFLFERHSPSLRATPVERLIDDWSMGVEPLVQEMAQAMLASFTGIFEVTQVLEGEGVWVRDVAGFGEYPVSEAAGAAVLQPGDILAGRLFPDRGAIYYLSRAAGHFRSEKMSAAIDADLVRLREERRGMIVRLSQLELEVMFWGFEAPLAQEPEGDPVGDARRLLSDAGIDGEDLDGLFANLATSPFDATRLVHGARDALSEFLDELAFETDIDLTEARRLLTLAWKHLAEPVPKEPEQRGPLPDRRQAVEAFGKALSSGTDKEVVFTNLERDLALDRDADEDDDSPAPDFPGVVGAVVDEFLWELGASESSAAAKACTCLASLSTFAARIGVFEELGKKDLLMYTSFWLHERDALAGPDEALELLAALERFCAWTEENHDVKLRTDFQDTIDRLRQSLPRIAGVNRGRKRDGSHTGELFEFLGAGNGLGDAKGGTHSVHLDAGFEDVLQAGDRVRGRIAADGSATVYCCYPPEAALLADVV